MTSTPPDEPQPHGATPPPPSGYEAVPPTTPPPYGSTPPPAGAYPPPAGSYPSAPGGYAPPPGYGAPAAGTLSDSDQRLWATLAHVLPILGLSFLPPLIIWLVFRERGRFVDEQGKEALNFQITLAIAYVVGAVLSIVGIGVLILLAAWLLGLVLGIIAAIAANRGEAYRYPFNWRIIK